MMLDILDFSVPAMFQLGADAVVAVLLVVLIISFRSRGRVFCQYLKIMTGIRLDPVKVKMLYKSRGKAGVRDLLIDLIIQKDLADPSRLVTPGSKPKPTIYDSGVFED
ncbi:MAG: hypothetical protein ABFS37_16915 [Acidobacteriota bacterium]